MARRSQAAKRGSVRQGRAAMPQQKNSMVLLWVVIGAVALIVIGVVVMQGQLLQGNKVPVSGQVSEGTSWGPAGAPVTVVEFSNFGCSHCRAFATDQGKQLRQEYEATGKVRFEFKQFRLGDASTTDAANASLCAADQGRFWDYHDVLFAKQGVSAAPFSTAALKQYGGQIGLDAAKFNSCVDNNTHLDRVYSESQDGQMKGVTGTPTFFINGKQIVGAVPYAEFKQAVDAALQGG